MINRICNLIKRRGTACHIKRWYNTNTFVSHFQVCIFAFVLLQFVQHTKYDENEVRWNWSIKNSWNHFTWNITKYFLLTYFLCFADDHLFLLVPKEYTKIPFHTRLSLEENLAGAWATWRGEEKRPWPPSRIRPPSSSPLPLSLSFVLMLSCSLILLQKGPKKESSFASRHESATVEPGSFSYMARLSSFCNAFSADGRRRRKGPFCPSCPFSSHSVVPIVVLSLLLSWTYCTRRALRPQRGQRGLQPEPSFPLAFLAILPHTPSALSYRYFERPSVPSGIPQNDGSCCRKPVQHAI